MYNIEQIKEALFGLVGINQPQNPKYEKIETTLSTSESGLFIDDIHPLCTVENIYQIAPEFNEFLYDSYDVSTSYSVNYIIEYQENIYKSLQDANLGNTPGSAPLFWELLQEKPTLSNYLKRYFKIGIQKAIQSIFDAKKLKGITKSIFDSIKIFEGAGLFTDTISKTGSFRGIEIRLKRNNNITLNLDRIGLQLDTIQAIDLPIYIYHSSQKEAIFVKNVTTGKANSFTWRSFTDIILHYDSLNHDSGGSYYLGYYEDDLTGQAIEKNIDFSHPFKCSSCSQRTREYYNLYNDFVVFAPFLVRPEYFDGVDLFDIDKISYVYNSNNGLNLSISVKCDMTQFIIENKLILSDVISKSIAQQFISNMANNFETSGPAETLRERAIITLSEQGENFNGTLKEAIKASDFDLSDLKSSCLPCNDSSGVYYESI